MGNGRIACLLIGLVPTLCAISWPLAPRAMAASQEADRLSQQAMLRKIRSRNQKITVKISRAHKI